ncbi:MAG TPA: hypothetical protein VLF93_06300 [Candidatus Saccharimonadales bacterium]|nr:hypothetical protein [Candidatus Saccharimonadales bacterium]
MTRAAEHQEGQFLGTRPKFKLDGVTADSLNASNQSVFFVGIDPTPSSYQEKQQIKESYVRGIFSRLPSSFYPQGLGSSFDGKRSSIDIVAQHLLARNDKELFDLFVNNRAAKALVPIVYQFVDRPVIETHEIQGHDTDNLYVYPTTGHPIGDNLRLFYNRQNSQFILRPGRVDPYGRQGMYVPAITEDGNLIMNSVDKNHRFRTEIDEAGAPHFYQETALTISQQEADRFKGYSKGLNTYEDLYWRAISMTGYDIYPVLELLDKPIGNRREICSHLFDIGSLAATFYETTVVPYPRMMVPQATQLILERNNPAVFQDGTKMSSLHMLEGDIARYFSAFIQNGYRSVAAK